MVELAEKVPDACLAQRHGLCGLSLGAGGARHQPDPAMIAPIIGSISAPNNGSTRPSARAVSSVASDSS